MRKARVSTPAKRNACNPRNVRIARNATFMQSTQRTQRQHRTQGACVKFNATRHVTNNASAEKRQTQALRKNSQALTSQKAATVASALRCVDSA